MDPVFTSKQQWKSFTVGETLLLLSQPAAGITARCRGRSARLLPTPCKNREPRAAAIWINCQEKYRKQEKVTDGGSFSDWFKRGKILNLWNIWSGAQSYCIESLLTNAFAVLASEKHLDNYHYCYEWNKTVSKLHCDVGTPARLVKAPGMMELDRVQSDTEHFFFCCQIRLLWHFPHCEEGVRESVCVWSGGGLGGVWRVGNKGPVKWIPSLAAGLTLPRQRDNSLRE